MAEAHNNNNNNHNKNSDYLYKVERVCGNGSFGIVFQAKIIHTGEIVAIKKVYQDRRYKNREYSIIKSLSHPNIIKVLHAFYTTGEMKDEIYLNIVMNYVSDNLFRMIRNYYQKNDKNKEEMKEIKESKDKIKFPLFLIKLYTFQIARALSYIHSLHICHRDIKPQNILIEPSTNKVFLCDFGSAKLLHDYNNVFYICSRYYRAPELIMETEKYNESIDIWSLGCVIVEMIKGKPFFKAENANEQLQQIFEIFGCPQKDDLNGIRKKKQILESAAIYEAKKLDTILPGVPKDLINLLSKIFVYNGNKRITATEIMAHPYFDELRNKNVCQNNGKYIIPNIFDFSKKEISSCKQKNLWKKIIPEWSEGYNNLKREEQNE